MLFSTVGLIFLLSTSVSAMPVVTRPGDRFVDPSALLHNPAGAGGPSYNPYSASPPPESGDGTGAATTSAAPKTAKKGRSTPADTAAWRDAQKAKPGGVEALRAKYAAAAKKSRAKKKALANMTPRDKVEHAKKLAEEKAAKVTARRSELWKVEKEKNRKIREQEAEQKRKDTEVLRASMSRAERDKFDNYERHKARGRQQYAEKKGKAIL
ncbi:hypothetical protein C8J56DRAFT_922280 [Mycena floridula]|nr:hypothetical protein C8J56DRAFT_922280 [Mycena floridula]